MAKAKAKQKVPYAHLLQIVSLVQFDQEYINEE